MHACQGIESAATRWTLVAELHGLVSKSKQHQQVTEFARIQPKSITP